MSEIAGNQKMVNEVKKRTQTIFVCELCGFAYRDLETAECCEQYCYSHGHSCRGITQRATGKPPVQVMKSEPKRHANVSTHEQCQHSKV
jgi:hypothetical protein